MSTLLNEAQNSDNKPEQNAWMNERKSQEQHQKNCKLENFVQLDVINNRKVDYYIPGYDDDIEVDPLIADSKYATLKPSVTK